uniref:Major facilitator superfamily (MFS) profile domain-containing protein n=1 Tax=Lepeophtheirus salmonis TaxID=72036 RepID=A0A0K2ULV3_LEPSM
MPDDAMLSVGSVHGRGNVYKQIYCSGVASLLQLMQGCVIPISSIILPQIQSSNSEFSITKDQGSWFASFLCLGFLTGAVVGWIQSEYFGRKKSLMIDGFIATGGILIISFTRSYPLLIFARFLCGHASGSGTVSIPIYCSEVSHPEIRGVTASFIATFYYLGYSITTVLGASLPWRLATALVAIFPTVSVILLCFCPESPVWLLRKGKDVEAMKSLLFFRGSESAAEEEKQTIMASLLWQNKDNQACGTRSAKIQQCIKRIQSPSFWKPFLIIFFMLVVLTEWSGLPLIAFYMIDILGQVGLPCDPYKFASFLAIARLIISKVSLAFLYKCRKRPLYFTSISFMILGNIIISTYDYLHKNGYFEEWGISHIEIIKWIPAFGLAMLYCSASAGYVQITYSIQGELFPSDTRALGGGAIGICDGISLFLSTKAGPSIIEILDISGFFALNAFVLLSCLIFTFFFLPETYGLHLEEIESIFLGKDDTKKNEIKGENEKQEKIMVP